MLVTQLCPTLCSPTDFSLPGSSVRGIFPGKNTGVGCHFLLQGIFPTQGLNLRLLPRLLHCTQTLLLLCHWQSPTHLRIVSKIPIRLISVWKRAVSVNQSFRSKELSSWVTIYFPASTANVFTDQGILYLSSRCIFNFVERTYPNRNPGMVWRLVSE